MNVILKLCISFDIIYLCTSIKNFKKWKTLDLTWNRQFIASVLTYWSLYTYIYRLGNNAGVTQLSHVLPLENNRTHTHGLITYFRPISVGICESSSDHDDFTERKRRRIYIGSAFASEQKRGRKDVPFRVYRMRAGRLAGRANVAFT